MKRIIVLASLISAPIYAHRITAKSQFFKDQIAKDPDAQGILNYCNLVGITDEETCRAEFFTNDQISKDRLQAAKTCVEKSGVEHRARLDLFFKNDGEKAAWAGSKDANGEYHTFYADGHRHEFTEEDKQEAGDLTGTEAVIRLKERWIDTKYTNEQIHKDFFSDTSSSTFKNPVLDKGTTASEGSEKSWGKSTERGPLSQEMLNEAYTKGFQRGYAVPERTSVNPRITCDQDGPCRQNSTGYFTNPDNGFKVTNSKTGTIDKTQKVIPEKDAASPKPAQDEGKTATPAPGPTKEAAAAKEAEEKEGTAEAPKDKTDVEKVDGKKEKDVTTAINDEIFVRQMNDCIATEENELLIAQSSKTVDPDAQSAEEKKAEAEEKLKAGTCDESFFGADFCQKFKKDKASREAQDAEITAKAAKEQALENFQKNGVCDPMVLGIQFCQNAKAFEDSDKDNPADEGDSSHVGEGSKEAEAEGAPVPGDSEIFWIKPGTPHPLHGADGAESGAVPARPQARP